MEPAPGVISMHLSTTSGPQAPAPQSGGGSSVPAALSATPIPGDPTVTG